MNLKALVVLLFSLTTYIGAQAPSADLVIINANVRTMAAQHPKAASIAVVDNKIAAVRTSG